MTEKHRTQLETAWKNTIRGALSEIKSRVDNFKRLKNEALEAGIDKAAIESLEIKWLKEGGLA